MKSFEHRLREESDAWVRDGLISVDQRAAVLARYPDSPAEGSRYLAILALIGGALFIIGVSLVIKSNWEALGDWTKILGLVALLICCHLAGWGCKVTPGRYPRLGDAFFMAGAVCFLLGIALVSQIFHLNSRPANGVLLWWVGIAALPWLVRAKGMQFVSVVGLTTWLFMEMAAQDSWIRLCALQRGGDTFIIFSATAYLIGVAWYGFGAALRPTTRVDFAGLHETVGLVLASASLYLVGFSWSAHHWTRFTPPEVEHVPVALLVLLAAGSLAYGGWRHRSDLRGLAWGFLAGALPILAVLLGLNLADGGWLVGGLACVALFVLNLGMVRVGAATGRESWINLGIVGIAVNIITRYFLLFGTLIEGGLFFIVSGILVLGLGYYLERERRRLVRTAREEGVS